MTAEEWEACQDPGAMLDLLGALRPVPGERKCRLCSVALCRRIRPFPSDGRARAALEAAEQFAEDWDAEPIRLAAWRGAVEARVPTAVLYAVSGGQLARDARLASATALENPASFAEERWTQSQLVRCIFGSPFRPPVSFGSAVLAHNGGAAVKLATVTYEDRSLPSGELDSVRLAILADALEEAGVDDAAALQHLRGPGPHCRGCHVVDAVLGRS